jgi:hypothetical protein
VDHTTDHASVACELATPQAVAEDDDVLAARLLLVRAAGERRSWPLWTR